MAVSFYGKLTVFLPCDSYRPFSEKTLTKFYAFLQFHQLYTYISFPYENITENHIYYKQAAFLSSFYSEHTLIPEDYIVYYRNHFLQHTFSLCKDFTTLKSTIHPDIYKMIRSRTRIMPIHFGLIWWTEGMLYAPRMNYIFIKVPSFTGLIKWKNCLIWILSRKKRWLRMSILLYWLNIWGKLNYKI